MDETIKILMCGDSPVFREVARLLAAYNFRHIDVATLRSSICEDRLNKVRLAEQLKDLHKHFDLNHRIINSNIIVDDYSDIDIQSYDIVIANSEILRRFDPLSIDTVIVLSVDTDNGMVYKVHNHKNVLVVDYQMMTYKRDRISDLIKEMSEDIRASLNNPKKASFVAREVNTYLLHSVFRLLNKEQIQQVVNPDFCSWDWSDLQLLLEDNEVGATLFERIKRYAEQIELLLSREPLLSVDHTELYTFDQNFLEIIKVLNQKNRLWFYELTCHLELHDDEKVNNQINNFLRLKSQSLKSETLLSLKNDLTQENDAKSPLRWAYFKFWFNNMANLRVHRMGDSLPEGSDIDEEVGVTGINTQVISGIVCVEVLKLSLRVNFPSSYLKLG